MKHSTIYSVLIKNLLQNKLFNIYAYTYTYTYKRLCNIYHTFIHNYFLTHKTVGFT